VLLYQSGRVLTSSRPSSFPYHTTLLPVISQTILTYLTILYCLLGNHGYFPQRRKAALPQHRQLEAIHPLIISKSRQHEPPPSPPSSCKHTHHHPCVQFHLLPLPISCLLNSAIESFLPQKHPRPIRKERDISTHLRLSRPSRRRMPALATRAHPSLRRIFSSHPQPRFRQILGSGSNYIAILRHPIDNYERFSLMWASVSPSTLPPPPSRQAADHGSCKLTLQNWHPKPIKWFVIYTLAIAH